MVAPANAITLKDKQTNESTVYEITLTEDTMKLSGQDSEYSSLFDHNIFKRIKK